MRQKKNMSGRKDEQGIIIALVAVFMLAVVGAMAALSIDVVTFYTARSEAQLAADAAALAGARVLANSGMTSDPTNALTPSAEVLAGAVALQVGQQNQVGGRNLIAANGEVVVVGFGGTPTNPCTPPNNPCITVHVQRTDLPTFFARIWGSKQVTVGASATAEAYNPSGASASPIPVAPMCVKPWLLPNMDPRDPSGATAIFSPTNGAITAPTAPTALLGWESPSPPNAATRLSVVCTGGDCSTGLPTPVPWKYYPGDPGPASFPPPTQALPTCSQVPTPTPYQESIAGCIQTPIACNSTVSIDISPYLTRDSETVDAVNCLTHSTANNGDKVDLTAAPSPPFQFLAGDDNPISGLAGNDVMVSDSLVTVPVFNSTTGTAPTGPVAIIGFVQLFLNPGGLKAPPLVPPPYGGTLRTTVINMAGCGINATGTAILGNGASPVAVRLITAP